MKARQLEKLGVPRHLAKFAKWSASSAHQAGMSHVEIKERISSLLANPSAFRDDPHFGEVAKALAIHVDQQRKLAEGFTPKDPAAPFGLWGDDLDSKAVEQMENACTLPVSIRGALMPDAHLGYGLPIGGVLATKGAIIPYAVGVDIACRMKLSILDLEVDTLRRDESRFVRCLEKETRFGMGSEFGGRVKGRAVKKRDHEVMDADWSVTETTSRHRDRAHAQLGTSGSGNHFVEFGVFTIEQHDLGLDAGRYLALLSHSGSRGVGASVCSHYSKVARQSHPELPRELAHLGWLDLDSEAGQEYWQAMTLMGAYASANHDVIHKSITKHLGARVVQTIENHHNFAWKEVHQVDDGRGGKELAELIVHRKGATPADKGALGIIPGSMATPGYIVRGRGDEASLRSASHGAGRIMSRRQAKLSYRWAHVRDYLSEKGVKVIRAGIDEIPFAYKDIDLVMGAQKDLVDTIARFDPKLVMMAPDGEKPED